MKTLFTAKEMLVAITGAVVARGEDYVYPASEKRDVNQRKGNGKSCMYRFPDDSPGCIIGLAFSYLDPHHRLEEHVSAETVLEPYCWYKACQVAQEAQRVQDRGGTWGQALSAAQRYFDEDGGLDF